MTSLDVAIEQSKAAVDVFGQGTSAQPKFGSVEWFQLRAATLALAYLRRLNTLGLGNDEIGADLVYKQCNREFKAADV